MPNYYNNPYQQFYQPQVNPYPQNNTPNQQVQNSGFVSVPNEDIVNSYPVAHGNCVTFKIEGQPIVMEKSMGFSQFESPKIKRYRLVEEEVEVEETIPTSTEVDDIKKEIELIWSAIEGIRNVSVKKATPKRKDDNGGED